MEKKKAKARIYVFDEDKFLLDQMADKEYTIPAWIVHRLLKEGTGSK